MTVAQILTSVTGRAANAAPDPRRPATAGGGDTYEGGRVTDERDSNGLVRTDERLRAMAKLQPLASEVG